ncbi:MAG: PKD domain-containing protein [Thermoanaerobaculaceae bacterium]
MLPIGVGVVAGMLAVGAAVAPCSAQTLLDRREVTLRAPQGGLHVAMPPAGVGDTPDATVVLLNDSFEGAFPAAWTLRYAGTKAWWGVSTFRPKTGARGVYCAAGGEPPAGAGGPYFANMNAWMTWGPFSMADATSGRLTLSLLLKTQYQHDYFGYLASIDGSLFHGYWSSGDTTGWITDSLDLTNVPDVGSVLGRPQVWIALVFQSDAATQLEGVYVDDVYLEKTTAAPPCTLTCDGSSPATGVAGVPVQFTGSATATNCTGQVSYAWDFADGTVGSTLQNPTHAYAVAGVYPWRFTASVADKTCYEDGSITITSAQPCTLACTATVPQSALVDAPVAVSATATPSNCSGGPTYAWDWGDGTPFGTTAAASHTYTRAGTFTWKLTAAVGSVTCTKTGTVTARQAPPIAEAGAYVYVLASSGHLAGAAGSNWVSDAVLHNPATAEATTFLYFLRKGINGTNASGVRAKVPAGQSVKLADLVLATFGQSSASGAVLVGSDRPLVVTSRTYNTAAAGTYGQYIEGYPTAQAVAGIEEVRLIGLARNATYRTNIGFANATGSALDVTVELRRADGSLLGTKPVRVEPWSYGQENDIVAAFSQSVDNLHAIVRASQTSARYFTYASVIDGRTNDPIQVVPVGRQTQSAAAASAPADPASTTGTVAGINQWTSLGGGVAAVFDFAVHPTDPNTILAGTSDGLFKTVDGGSTWSLLAFGGASVGRVMIAPGSPGTLFATSGSLLQRSTDGGVSWVKVEPPSTCWSCYFFAIAPGSPTTLYTFGYAGTDLWRSTDLGAAWTKLAGSQQGWTGQCLAFDPQNPSVMYGGSHSYGGTVIKSTNGGSTWTQLTSSLSSAAVVKIAVDPRNSNVVLAGTALWQWDRGGEIYRSSNGGTAWTKVATGISPTSVRFLAADPRVAGLFFAAGDNGVFRSTDAGVTWSPATSGLAHLSTRALAFPAGATSTVLAGTGGGVFRSVSGGTAWTASSPGLPPATIARLAIDARSPRRLYAAGDWTGGVWVSTNDGTTWTAGQGLVTAGWPSSITPDPATPGGAYVSSDAQGVLKTTNGGTTWSPANSGLGNLMVWSFALDPQHPQNLFAGCYYIGSTVYRDLYRSTNGGQSWSLASNDADAGNVTHLVIDPENPLNLYANMGLSGGVYRSRDGGTTWDQATTGLGNRDLGDLVIDPSDPRVLYAATGYEGLFKTTDGATSWARLQAYGAGGGAPIALDPRNTAVVYAGSRRSRDGGASWSDLPAPPRGIRALAVDPADSSLYAGTTSGVYKITLLDCTYTLSATSRDFPHAGGSGSVNVSTSDSRCTWSAVSNAAWVTVTSGASGTGAGTVAYAVAANTATAARTGTVTIAGKTFTVTQAGKPAGPEPIYIPGAAHVAGSAGTNWKTDLEVHNPGATQASYTVALLKRDQDNPAPAEKPFTLGPGLSVRYPDALSGLFSHSGGATLRVTATQGQVMVTSRTYNDQPNGTYGQFVPGAPLSVAFGQGVTARLVQLAYSTDAKKGFRTNLGLVNASSLTIAVWVDLYRGDGTLLGTRGASLGPYRSTQLNDVFSTVTTADVADGFALVRTTTAGGAFFAYASVIDNLSGDPIYIPARVPQ